MFPPWDEKRIADLSAVEFREMFKLLREVNHKLDYLIDSRAPIQIQKQTAGINDVDEWGAPKTILMSGREHYEAYARGQIKFTLWNWMFDKFFLFLKTWLLRWKTTHMPLLFMILN